VVLGEEEWALAGLLHTGAAGSGVFFFFPLLHFPSTSPSQVFLEVFNQLKMLQMRWCFCCVALVLSGTWLEMCCGSRKRQRKWLQCSAEEYIDKVQVRLWFS
jgi:hypothetical protein